MYTTESTSFHENLSNHQIRKRVRNILKADYFIHLITIQSFN